MSDPRDLFRAALEDEWGSRRDRPGLEGRVSRRLRESAAGDPRRPDRWLALSAVALGLILVVALGANTLGLLASRRHPPPAATNPAAQPSVEPSGSPVPDAEKDYGPPPIGTPLFYYVDQREPSWMVAVDWTGKIRGTLKAAQPIANTGGYDGGVLAVAPDGSRIILGAQVVDARGQGTGATVTSDKTGFIWADDSRHLCAMSPQFSPSATLLPQTLMTFLPGGQPRASARVGMAGNQAGAGIYACSFQSGRGLVVQNYNQAASESWLVNLTSGAVVHHQTYPSPGNGFSTLTVSHDGAYVAESLTTTVPNGPSTAGPSVIRSGVTGAVLATTPAGTQVTAFSWDGSLAVLQGTVGTGTAFSTDVRVIEWRTGRVVWRLDASKIPGSSGLPLDLDQALANPGGRDIALSFQRMVPCSTPGTQTSICSSYDELREILLVHADGSFQEIATEVHPVW
jgi:hypothetical protein